MERIFTLRQHIDWILFAAVLPILGAGFLTMNSFTGESEFGSRQVVWIGLSFVVFFIFSFIDFRFLRRTGVLVALFLASVASLVFLIFFGHSARGAQSWFNLGAFSVQPSDPAKIILILILAKYFSRRHIEIANIRHILVSGFYVLVFFFLLLLEPDFGSAIIVFLIWLGMVLISGISKKHLIGVFLIAAVVFSGLWFYVFKDYQKQRIKSFMYPLTDIRGAGYNAYQSTIAVGSGQILGKGIGYGTQSRLKFLPEYQTDFIFAAFAEEWGFIGVVLLFLLYCILIWRILRIALYGASNFETLFAVGVIVLLMSHFLINVGMNIGLMPVTGVVMPFMSYGGSHLLSEFAALGILMGMRRYSRQEYRRAAENDILGIV